MASAAPAAAASRTSALAWFGAVRLSSRRSQCCPTHGCFTVAMMASVRSRHSSMSACSTCSCCSRIAWSNAAAPCTVDWWVGASATPLLHSPERTSAGSGGKAQAAALVCAPLQAPRPPLYPPAPRSAAASALAPALSAAAPTQHSAARLLGKWGRQGEWSRQCRGGRHAVHAPPGIATRVPALQVQQREHAAALPCHITHIACEARVPRGRFLARARLPTDPRSLRQLRRRPARWRQRRAIRHRYTFTYHQHGQLSRSL